jgi:hypothetical protein
MRCVSCEDWSWNWLWARVAGNEFGAASCSFQICQGLLCKVGDVLCFLLMQAPSFAKKKIISKSCFLLLLVVSTIV